MKNKKEVIDFLIKKYNLNEEETQEEKPDTSADFDAKIKQATSQAGTSMPKPTLSKPAEKPVRIGGAVK
jgi:hypothetical protein